MSVAILSSGCATATRGTSEAMVVETKPIGATVTISNEHMGAGIVCQTPCSVEMPRKRGFSVKVEKVGYETIETKVITRVEGAGSAGMAGNVLLGGVIGAGVDAMTGAMKGFAPNPLVLELVPLEEEMMEVTDEGASTNGIDS